MPLTLNLFGPFQMLIDGKPLPRLRSRKGQWLLALLALRHDREVTREWLAGTLWPDSLESQGLANLRLTLTDLRTALGAEAERLHSPTPRTLRLELDGTETDLLIFDAGVTREDRASLEKAVAVYRGPLLEGCAEEWAFLEREAREQAYLRALERLAKEAMEAAEWSEAVSTLRRMIVTDPLRETAYLSLMQSLAADGDYAEVVQVYRELRERLYEELQAEPSAETTALYRELRTAGQETGGRKHRAGALERIERESSVPSAPLPPCEPPSSRLPRLLTSFIGREGERKEVKASLASAHLVTLTGTGGVGKTRLALEIAEESMTEFPGGVWFVELAGLSDPDLVGLTAAGEIGVHEQAGQPLIESLTAFLNRRSLSGQMLLVLDNCEHLVEACARLTETLLQQCNLLRILATSRQALGVPGEWVRLLPPFALPDLDEPDIDSSLLNYEAVRLFVERVQQAQPTLTWSPESLRKAAQLCCRLDGVPLAIELAAARMKVLGIDQLAERLEDRFRLLVGGSRTAQPRQQALRALIDWSYGLLTVMEKTLLNRLSVFAGGWTLEAAESVGSDEEITSYAILPLLEMLIEKSLVVTEELGSGIARYRLLETVRQYSAEKLQEAGEEALVHARHLTYFLQLAEEAEQQLRGSDQARWLNLLETDQDNLRAALEWNPKERDEGRGKREENPEYLNTPIPEHLNTRIPETSSLRLRLVAALSRYWTMRGYLTEGRQFLRNALAQAGAEERTAARARALLGVSLLARQQNDYATAQGCLEESLEIEQELGNRSAVGELFWRLGQVAHHKGEFVEACRLFEEALGIGQETNNRWVVFRARLGLGLAAGPLYKTDEAQEHLEAALEIGRELNDGEGIATTLNSLGEVVFFRGDYDKARSLMEEALRISRELHVVGTIATNLTGLGYLVTAQGDFAEARRLFEEALAIVRDQEDRRGIAWALVGLGRVACNQGEFAEANRCVRESLLLRRELKDNASVVDCLGCLSEVAFAQGQAVRGARLLGAVEALQEGPDFSLPPEERKNLERRREALQAALGEKAFAMSLAEGRAMTMEQAIEFALGA